MHGDNPESEVARPKLGKVKRQQITVTLDPSLIERARALEARTGLSVSLILERVAFRSMAVFEADPGELLRETPEE